MKLILYFVCLMHLCLQFGIFTKDLILSAIYVKSRGAKNEDKDK